MKMTNVVFRCYSGPSGCSGVLTGGDMFKVLAGIAAAYRALAAGLRP